MNEKEITSLETYTALETELYSIASRAKTFTAPNKDIQRELQKARKFLVDTGKFLREDYTRRAKEIGTKEKELLAIITPEENRLKALDDEEKERIEIH